jgi:hypothetical protein
MHNRRQQVQVKVTPGHHRRDLAARALSCVLAAGSIVVGTGAGTAAASSLLLSASGGPQAASTKKFKVAPSANGFHVNWTFTCGSATGDFGYNVYWNQGSGFKKGPYISDRRKGTGVSYDKGSGTYWLYVHSSCKWSLRALAGR